MTAAPSTIMHASIVTSKIVRIALMIATLNNLEIKLGDILNANVQVSATERCGPLWVMSLVKIPVRLH